MQGKTYFNQVNKLNENSNSAIRNVMKSERQECMKTLNTMREVCNKEKIQYQQSLQQQLDDWKRQVEDTNKRCKQLEQDIKYTEQKYEDEIRNREKYIDAALLQQRYVILTILLTDLLLLYLIFQAYSHTYFTNAYTHTHLSSTHITYTYTHV